VHNAVTTQLWITIILAGIGMAGSLAVGLVITFVKNYLDRQTGAFQRIETQSAEITRAEIRRVEEKFAAELRAVAKSQELLSKQVELALHTVHDDTDKALARYDKVLAGVIRMHKGFEDRFSFVQKQWEETHVWVKRIVAEKQK
jgi:hypothetical protein